MKTATLVFCLLISLVLLAQGQRPLSQYILDWSPKRGQVTLTCRDTPQRAAQVFDVQNLDKQSLARVLNVSANTKALLYIHCWLGETRFFHRRSMGWLSHALQASVDTAPVVLIALRWPSGKPDYRHSANRAGRKGAGAAPLLRALGEVFPDGRLDVFCHSMGNRLFQGMLAALESRPLLPSPLGEGPGVRPPTLGRVVLFSPDVDADVFCTDFERLAAVSTGVYLYKHRRDRALWFSQRLLHRSRLGRSGPTALPEGVVLDITDMSHLRSFSNHTHFSKKVVQQDLGRVFGLGERADFLRNPNRVWTADIEQDWVVDIPSLEDEWDEGITTLKLLRTKQSEVYWSSSYLADLVFQAALRGNLPIFKDPHCQVPADPFGVYPDRDTIIGFDPETYEEKKQVVYVEPVPSWDFKFWRLRQVLTYRAKTATWSTQVQAVAPLILVKNAAGDSIGLRPLFWFRPNDERPKLTSKHIVWAKEMVNKQARTEVPLTVFKHMKTVGNIPDLLLHLQEVLEKRMDVPLYNSAGDGLLSPERRRSLITRIDTVICPVSREPYEETHCAVYHDMLRLTHYLRLMQTWYWDERRHRLFICLDAVAPLTDALDSEGNFRFRRPLFYWRARR